MDILYVLGRGSTWDNNELRYSLRSIERFGRGVGNVYVVGYDPHFLSNAVKFIPYKDRYNRKHKNILDAICYALDNSDIGEDFLLSSDDHIYIKETDFEAYPYFRKGVLPSTPPTKRNAAANYRLSLMDTRKLLIEHGLPYHNFSHHGNTHLSRRAINNALPLIEESFNRKYGCEPTCLILNAWYKKTPFNILDRRDLKISARHSLEDVAAKFTDREVISFDNNPHESIRNYLFEMFPNKSRYEK